MKIAGTLLQIMPVDGIDCALQAQQLHIKSLIELDRSDVCILLISIDFFCTQSQLRR